MHSIHHQVAIRAPLARVFRALNDQAEIGAWWCPQDVTDTPDGLVMSHQAGPYGTVRLRVLRRDAATGVTWTCISQHPPDNPASAWTGTRLVFDLSECNSGAALVERAVSSTPIAALTTVDFRHEGYDLSHRFAGFNSWAWALVLQALKQACEAEADSGGRAGASR